MQEPAAGKLERIRRFYKRNNVLFWCIGLFSFGHLFWWNVSES
jgi:predicted negative regulator of RcsB-dependent stress response